MNYILIFIPILFGIAHLIAYYKPFNKRKRTSNWECQYYSILKPNPRRIFNPGIGFYRFDECFRVLQIQTGYDLTDICIVICNIQLNFGSFPLKSD